MDAAAGQAPAGSGMAALFRSAGIEATDDPDDCVFASADLSGAAAEPAGAVLRPADQAEVEALVRVARRHGVALFPRGGGWSYTGGFRTAGPASAVVDTTRLQSVAVGEDGVVEAGAGVTWEALAAVLAPRGLRARSFGPLSGIGATVGGGAAQNGGFFGSAGHGAFGDGTICGGTVVDGTGTAVCLGPDDRIDGLHAPQPLVGDCGAFGIRTAVRIRTMPLPAETGFSSYEVPDGAAALALLCRLRGMGCLGEAYVFDPGTHANLARTGFSVIESAGLAGDLIRGRGGLLGRIGGLLRTARAGKAFVGELRWSVHLAFDGTAEEVEAAQAEAAGHAAAVEAEVIPDVIPRVTRARPFRRIKALLGPGGEAWLPCHGVFLPDDAAAGLAAAQAELARSGPVMAEHGMHSAILCSLIGPRVIVEPQLFWPDALGPAVRRMVTAEQLAAHGGRPANPAAREAALALRQRLTDALDAAGASHFQWGRSYRVPAGLREPLLRLKRRFDPDGIINPGVLGL